MLILRSTLVGNINPINDIPASQKTVFNMSNKYKVEDQHAFKKEQKYNDGIEIEHFKIKVRQKLG